MIITCDKCNTRFSLDDALIKATGTKVRCKQCENVFDVYPSGRPASDDKGYVEISGLELESKSLSPFSAEKSAGESPERKSGGIDFEFEFEESEEDSKDADEDLELKDEDLDFELEMESEGQTKVRGLEPEVEFSDEDLKLELEPSATESEDALTPKAADEEEMFELDLELEPVEFKGAEPKEAFSEEEIDISEIEKILDMEEDRSEPETGDEEMELDLELDLEDEETAESASSPEEDVSEEEGFDINLALEGAPETDFAPRESVDSKAAPIQFREEKLTEAEPEEPLTMVDKDRKAQAQPFDIGTLAEPEEAEEEEEPAFSIGSYEPEKRRGSRSLVYLLVVLILAGAGYGAFWMMQNKGIKIPFISQLFKLSPADETGSLNISTTEVASRFVTTAKQGRLFVITGKARNDYLEPRSAINITAKLYAPGKVLVGTQSVFCGNFLSDLELESLDVETIQKILQNRSGDNYSGERIDPGKEIPFMAVFSSLPDNLEEFTVEVEGSSPVKP